MISFGRFTVGDVQPWDVSDLFTLFSDPAVTRYLGLRTLGTMDDAYATLTRYKAGPTRWLRVAADGEFIGLVGVEVEGHQATVLIAFRPTKKARGAGREFSVPFVQWLFSQPQIWRVWAYCHVDNTPVQRVLERMGAECEGKLRRYAFFPNIGPETPQDVYVYSIVRD